MPARTEQNRPMMMTAIMHDQNHDLDESKNETKADRFPPILAIPRCMIH